MKSLSSLCCFCLQLIKFVGWFVEVVTTSSCRVYQVVMVICCVVLICLLLVKFVLVLFEVN